MGKKVLGRKRKALGDAQGKLMGIKGTGAEVAGPAGGITLLERLRGRFPKLQLLWGDSRYGGKLREWAKEHFGWEGQTVRKLGTPSHARTIEPEPKTKDAKGGFVLQPRRLVVERTFA